MICTVKAPGVYGGNAKLKSEGGSWVSAGIGNYFLSVLGMKVSVNGGIRLVCRSDVDSTCMTKCIARNLGYA